MGMAVTAWTGGRLGPRGGSRHPHESLVSHEAFFAGRIPRHELDAIRAACEAQGTPLHDAIMDRAGWPAIPHDGRLLVTHQDALLLGGKVQAPAGYADHVVVIDAGACRTCGARLCIEACSGEALTPGPEGAPLFDRDKCVHCGACAWNCTRPPDSQGRTNIEFRAGAGGLHSSEN